MSRLGRRPRPGPVRRRSAEEFDTLLDGGASGDPRLDEMFTAARAPATAGELGSAAPALPAVADQDPTLAPVSRSRRVLTRLGAATLLTKAVTVAAGAVVVGAAAAGATGHLPGQHRHRAPVVVPGSSTGSSGSAPRSDAPSSGGRTSSSSASSSPASSTASTSASAPSQLPALCRVWLALPPGSDAVRRQPRFEILIRAAGGVQAVSAFCRDLPTASPSGTGSGSSGRTSPSSTGSSSTRSPSSTRAILTPTSTLPSRTTAG